MFATSQNVRTAHQSALSARDFIEQAKRAAAELPLSGQLATHLQMAEDSLTWAVIELEQVFGAGKEAELQTA